MTKGIPQLTSAAVRQLTCSRISAIPMMAEKDAARKEEICLIVF